MRTFILITMFIVAYPRAEASYCIFNRGQQFSCFDNLSMCEKNKNLNFRSGDECVKQKELDKPWNAGPDWKPLSESAKEPIPRKGKKGTCLWIQVENKWKNDGCSSTEKECQDYINRYKTFNVKSECR